MIGEHSYLPHRGFSFLITKHSPFLLLRRRLRGFGWIAHTVRSRPPTTPCMQILNTPSMIIFRSSR